MMSLYPEDPTSPLLPKSKPSNPFKRTFSQRHGRPFPQPQPQPQPQPSTLPRQSTYAPLLGFPRITICYTKAPTDTSTIADKPTTATNKDTLTTYLHRVKRADPFRRARSPTGDEEGSLAPLLEHLRPMTSGAAERDWEKLEVELTGGDLVEVMREFIVGRERERTRTGTM